MDPMSGLEAMFALADFIKTMIQNYFELKEQLEETLTTVTALTDIVRRRKNSRSFNQQEFQAFLEQAMNDLKALDTRLKSPSFRTSTKEKLLAGNRLEELASLNTRLEARRKRLNTDVAVSMEQILQDIASVTSVHDANAKTWWEQHRFGQEIGVHLLRDAFAATFDQEASKPGSTFVKDRQHHQAIIDLMVDFLNKLCAGETVNWFGYQKFSLFGSLTDIYTNVSKHKLPDKPFGRGLIIATPGCLLMDAGSYKAAIKYFSDQLTDFSDFYLRHFLKQCCDKLSETMNTDIPAEEDFKKSVEHQLSILKKTSSGGGSVLHVIARSAADLPKADVVGQSDPYVVLTLNSEKAKSPRKEKTTAPVWDFEYEFKKVSPTDELKISVWDWNRIGKDKLLGETSISLRAIVGKKEEDYPLSLKGKTQGTIRLELNHTNQISALQHEIETSNAKIQAMKATLREAEETLRSDLMKEPEIPVVDTHGKLSMEGLYREKEFLDWDEFQRLMMRHMRARSHDLELLKAVLDTNGDNRIDRSELEHFFQWFSPITAEERYKKNTKPTSDVVKEWTMGAVAELLRQEWFHPLVDGDSVLEMLEKQPPGTFLIRFSGSQPGGYAISLRTTASPPNHCDQWKIVPLPSNAGTRLAVFDTKFNNLYQIVEYFRTNHLENDESIPLLTKPCPKKRS